MVDLKDYVRSEYVNVDYIKSLSFEKRVGILTLKTEMESLESKYTGEEKVMPVTTIILDGKPMKWRLNKGSARKLCMELGTETDKWEGNAVRLGWERRGAVDSVSVDSIISTKGVAAK